ncbi:MAG: protein-L-isoaspartate(D-aspartate) O-methyltransferase [Desulfobacteraceae bacterium]|nr:MAG: protein-L-isoaspartate(D-aspartate) O-methyltransferase [Desulfobacteraceae bacterium]
MTKRFHIIICLCVYSFCSVCCVASEPKEEEYTRLRHEMVKNQIESRGIFHPRVLDALKTVPRHRFVPEKNRNLAYNDHPLPIGEDQTISQPYIVALMTEILNPDPDQTVLEIGTGSGYQAAILAQLYKQVYTIEIIESLGKRSQNLLAERGYRNVQVKIGDGYQGWKEHSPFDAIIVTCAPTHIPEPLKEQLAEGGKMIIPVGEAYDQRLVLLVKEKGKIREKEVIPVRFVPMMGENGKTY